MKLAPESIPNVDLEDFPYAGSEKTAARLHEREHNQLVDERRCHAYRCREYHYCGRTLGRHFKLASEKS